MTKTANTNSRISWAISEAIEAFLAENPHSDVLLVTYAKRMPAQKGREGSRFMVELECSQMYRRPRFEIESAPWGIDCRSLASA